MKKLLSMISILLVLLMGACSDPSEPKLSTEQVKSIVVENHTGHIGKVEIISISHEGNEYIVEWENKENCESGMDYIDDKTGEIRTGEVSIC